MATPVRSLPARAGKSAARGVILSTVLQDHPRSFGRDRDGPDVQPRAQAAQAAQTLAESNPETPRSRRGRPKKSGTRNRTGFVGGFPAPVSDTEFETSPMPVSARAQQADQRGQPGLQESAHSLDNTLLGSPSGGHASEAAHGPQNPVQNIPNIIQNFAESLISALSGHSVAEPARTRAPIEIQAQAPQSDSDEAQATIPLNR